MDGNVRLVQGEDEERGIWKYFEELYNIDTQKRVAVHMWCFDRIQRGNYFDGGVKELKNGKVAGIDEITEKMIKGGGDTVVYWFWRLCNMPLRVLLCLETGDLSI